MLASYDKQGDVVLIEGALLWLTLNVYHEARGEDALSQRAVAHVTLNRAKKHGYDVEKVVKEPYQFSWTFDKKKLHSKPWKTDPDVFLRCSLNSVKAAISEDITKGATHFHERSMRPYPNWTKNMKVTLRYGAFVFYKDLEGVYR